MSVKQKQKFISRVYMYIFLSLSYLTWLGIVHTYAYAELDLFEQSPELMWRSILVAMVMDK